MKRKIFSKLLMGALLIASVSSFVSCKDYDDDINRLEDQINKAALQSNLDALQQKVDQNATTAAAAAANALKAAQDAAAAATNADATLKSDLEKAIAAVEKTANTNGTNLADAVKAISDLQAAVKAAQDAADAAATAAAGADAKAGAAATPADVEKAAADAKAALDKAVSELNAAIEAAQKAALEAAQKAQTTADAAATKAYADEIKTLAEEAKTIANEAKAALANCASKEEFNTLSTKVDGLNSDLTQKIGSINSKIADIEANYATKTYVDDKVAGLQNADQVKAAIEKALAQYGLSKADETVASQISTAVTSLQSELAQAFGVAEFSAIEAKFSSVSSAVDAIYSVITSVELVGSYHEVVSASQSGYFDNSRVFYYDPSTDSYKPFTTSAGYPYYTEYYYNHINTNPLQLAMQHGFVEETSVFGDEAYKDAAPLVNYEEGADIKFKGYLEVRVNPVNADITNKSIILVNSLGEGLDDYVKVTKVERSNRVVTRSTNIGSGLWKIYFDVADGVTDKAFTDATYTKKANGKNDRPILYGVAINNTDAAADRYVVSTYDVQPSYNTYMPARSFNFNVNGTSARDIRNRWSCYWNGSEYVGYIRGENVRANQNPTNNELAWTYETSDNTKAGIISPKANPTLTGKTANVRLDNYDARIGKQLIYAEVGEEIVLSDFTGYTSPDFYGSLTPVEYYYVVLDKGNAYESAPSEWNAWASYKYEGLGEMIPAGEDLTITINKNGESDPTNDVIGFRVYAVNYDGTLADPDGRAFYVYVGKFEQTEDKLSAVITATKASNESGKVSLENLFKYSQNVYIKVAENNPKMVNNSSSTTDARFDYLKFNFYDKKDNLLGSIATTGTGIHYIDYSTYKDAAYMKVESKDNKNLVDNEIYTFDIVSRTTTGGGDWYDVNITKLTVQKVLPTKSKSLTFRPKQEVDANGASKDGTNMFISYMVPNKNPWQMKYNVSWNTTFNIDEDYTVNVVSGKVAPRDNGFKDLNNVFYNLNTDKDFLFVFKNSLYGKDNAVVDLLDKDNNGIQYEKPQGSYSTSVAGTDVDVKYLLDVNTPFIDGKTWHDVAVSYVYRKVSTTLKDGAVDKFGADYAVDNEQGIKVMYSCWHNASSFSWAIKDDKSTKPVIKWEHDPSAVQTSPYTNIVSENTYDDPFFGLDLSKLITNKYLNDNNVKAELNTRKDGKGQKNPYFVPSIVSNTIRYNQVSTQRDAAPNADHTEYLRLSYVDAFGHNVVIVLDVDIKKPTK